ncbi:DinB family protein [Cecembia sp.]|uniref:DinB family protein n=1 Tax=Cecembia sp. TaxID=1898110 RepID=UPI0025BEFCDA|nr:DinB family protein [Cecembia sp.]
MKNLKNLLTLSLSFMLLLGVQAFVNAQTTIEEFAAKWENSKQFTLEVVDKMPDDLMNYKPHESAMSFAEQIIHLSSAAAGISQRFLNGADPGFDLGAKPSTKADMKAFVTSCFDYAKASVGALSAEQLAESVEIFGSTGTRRQVVALIDDHTTHHRGAAIAYIRANGIEPPRFRAM